MRSLFYSFLYLIVWILPAFAQDLTLTGTLASGWHYINGGIETQGTTVIGTGVDLDLVAQTKIRFYPGFRVEAGGTLRAAASPDTDGDLIHDIVEDRSGCQDHSLSDTDGDGLSDSEEDVNRNGVREATETSACSNDTDGDKMDDKWETDHGLDPLSDDGDLDPDGDNLSNYFEYYMGKSDPQDASSLPSKGTYYEYDDLGRIKKIIRIK